MLSLAIHFANAGVLPSLVIMALVAVQGCYGYLLLLEVQQHCAHKTGRSYERLSFEDVAEIVLGKVGRRIVQICVTTLQLGVCALIIQFVTTNLHVEFTGSHRWVMLVLVVAVCAGFSLLPDLSALTPISLWGNVGLAIVAASAVLASMSTLLFHPYTVDIPERTQFQGWSAMLAAGFYSFEGVSLVLPVGNALNRAATREYPKMLMNVTVIVLLMYMCVGGFVAAAYPDIILSRRGASLTSFLVEQNASSGDGFAGFYFALLDWMASFALLATFPLQMVPATQVLETALQPFRQAPASPQTKLLMKIGLVLGCTVAGLVLPKEKVVDLIGALTSTTLAAMPYVLHAVVMSGKEAEEKNSLALVLDAVVVFFCTMVMILGVSSALTPKPEFTTAPPTFF